MGLTKEHKEELNKKLDPKHVKKRPDSGMSYIEGWHAEAEANRIFDFEWNSEVLELIENTEPTKNRNNNCVVSFRARVRVTACGIVKEGIGFGSGIKQDIHSAYEDAIKEAETDALKRALKKFGNPFGLALYDKAQSNVGVDLTPEQEQVKKFILDVKSKIKKATTPEDVTNIIHEHIRDINSKCNKDQEQHINDYAAKHLAFLSQAPTQKGVNGYA